MINAVHRFNPAISATERDPAARALLAATPPGQTPRLVYGSLECPPGSALLPDLGVCCPFANGATETIEQLSLGDSNVWLARVLADGEPPPPAPDGDSPNRPWLLRHPDFTLFVFPIGVDAAFQCGEKVIHLPEGAMAGKLNFFPNGESTFVPANRSYAVRQAFIVFERIFAFLTEPAAAGLRPPAVFLGDSQEPRMLDFVARRLNMPSVAAGGPGRTMIGAVEDVRAAYEATKSTVERLAERAERERNWPLSAR